MLWLTGITIDDLPVQIAFAGDNTVLTLTGIDSTNLSIGNTASCSAVLSLLEYYIVLVMSAGWTIVIHWYSLANAAILSPQLGSCCSVLSKFKFALSKSQKKKIFILNSFNQNCFAKPLFSFFCYFMLLQAWLLTYFTSSLRWHIRCSGSGACNESEALSSCIQLYYNGLWV